MVWNRTGMKIGGQVRTLRPTCIHCVYWVMDKAAEQGTVGHCHRFPPTFSINPQSGNVIQKYPTTDRHHWCGEWDDDDTRLVDGLKRIAALSSA